MSALGGGEWVAQNKVLPGAYINFVAMARASASLSERGIATMPVIFDWGVQDEVMEVTASDFQRHSRRILGYDYTHPKLQGLRDLFKNIRVAYIYRLGTGGTKSQNDYATARFAGTRGNEITISIAPNIDEPTKWDVSTYFDNALIDVQTVADALSLTNNDFVTWKPEMVLEAVAGSPLVGGTSPIVTNADYQTYLDKIEGFNFNAIGCPSSDSGVKGLFQAFTKRMRDAQGVKFQCIMYNPSSNSDYEGTIDILNKVTNDDANDFDLVWWATGISAGTAVNRSATNNVYDGEFTVDCNYTQPDYERAIRGGKFAFHRVGNTEVRVLSDINSLVNLTLEKNSDFQHNQTIRVLDQIANDIAVLFNTKYLGTVPNDADGRISLWADIVHHHQQLQTIRAIENFNGEDVEVEQGDTKTSVLVKDLITPTNCMEKLYMSVKVA